MRIRVALVLATLLVACSDPQVPLTITYDAFYRGAWELTSIIDSAVDDHTPRSPTAPEARTWHVFSSEEYVADTVRAPVTVEWAGSSGSGYWYLCCGGVRIEVTLTGPGGGTEVYAGLFNSEGVAVGLSGFRLFDNDGYIEEYRKVGEP